jgi:integrase
MRKWVKEEPDYRTPKSNMMPLKKKQFFRDFVLLKANSALRVGEIRQLKWGMTSVIIQGSHKYINFDVPAEICKNRKSRSFVSRGGEYLERIKRYSNWTGNNDFVFVNNDDGKQISKPELYRMWGDLMRNCPIEDAEERELTPYSLRHFAITARLYSGVGVYEVAKQAGTTVQYIEQHYEHLDMKKLLATASKSFRVDKQGVIERFDRDVDD